MLGRKAFWNFARYVDMMGVKGSSPVTSILVMPSDYSLVIDDRFLSNGVVELLQVALGLLNASSEGLAGCFSMGQRIDYQSAFCPNPMEPIPLILKNFLGLRWLTCERFPPAAS